MQLSEQLLGTIIWSLAAKTPEPDNMATDGRRRLRLPTRGFATIYFGSPGQTRNVAVYDLSADGIAFVSTSPMDVDGKFVLALSKRARASNVICRVTHCSQEPEHYRIGASFVSFV